MKKWSLKNLRPAAAFFAIASFMGLPILAQDTGYYGQQAQASQYSSPQQIDDLVAPIALYPDALLSQVLVASSYPDQLAAAQQFLDQTRGLSGQALIEAAQQQNWDPSVQALVAFPDVVARLNQDMGWTNALGQAFRADEGAVMSAVQQMRQRAYQAGRLQSTPQQVVTTQYDNGEPAIEIEPANPDVLYVPVYNPAYIWGPPAYGYYPRLWYPGYGFTFGSGISVGAFFGGGWGGWHGWGWHPSWGSRTVVVNNTFIDRNGFRNSYRGPEGGSRGFAGNGGSYYRGQAAQPVQRYDRQTTRQYQANRSQSAPSQYRSEQPRYEQRYQSTPQRGFEQPQQRFSSAPQPQYRSEQPRYEQRYQSTPQRGFEQSQQRFSSAPQPSRHADASPSNRSGFGGGARFSAPSGHSESSGGRRR